MKTSVYINAYSSLSPLGSKPHQVLKNYKNATPLFEDFNYFNESIKVSKLPKLVEEELKLISQNDPYKHLDKTVLMALWCAKNINKQINFKINNAALSIGSSRGATHLLEQYHSQFIHKNKVPIRTSPTTTLGNIASWVGHELSINNALMEHSVTCSSGLFAIVNAVVWLKSKIVNQFFAGGAEAPITSFTIAQMKALGLYSKLHTSLPCASMNFNKKENTLVLGEAAGLFLLENVKTDYTIAKIIGIGTATEKIAHGSAISNEGKALQKSMQKALNDAQLKKVDAVIMHAPGTIKGDQAELKAVQQIFKENLPLLTSNKWLVGHTLGASGLLSIEMALLMLKEQCFFENPFFTNNLFKDRPLHTILINAIGFGGNCVSIIIAKP